MYLGIIGYNLLMILEMKLIKISGRDLDKLPTNFLP